MEGAHQAKRFVEGSLDCEVVDHRSVHQQLCMSMSGYYRDDKCKNPVAYGTDLDLLYYRGGEWRKPNSSISNSVLSPEIYEVEKAE